MERVLNKSVKQVRFDFRFIDVMEGTAKFNGNQAQYKNMLSMFDRLTIDDFIPEIAHLLEHEDLAHAITKLKSLSDAAAVNEAKKYCQSCISLIEHLEGYETDTKTALEAIDCFKTFLDDSVFLKREIEEFTGKPVSFEKMNQIFTRMKQSIEGKRLFENSLSLPLQENKGFDDKKLIFGTGERRGIKLPESSRVEEKESRQQERNAGVHIVSSSIKSKVIYEKEEEKCTLI